MISEEMMKASINHNNEKVARWQKLWTLKENDIQCSERKYRQILLKISTIFFYKHNLAYWFFISDLSLKIVFWFK